MPIRSKVGARGLSTSDITADKKGYVRSSELAAASGV
jgi:hypothetical protein